MQNPNTHIMNIMHFVLVFRFVFEYLPFILVVWRLLSEQLHFDTANALIIALFPSNSSSNGMLKSPKYCTIPPIF